MTTTCSREHWIIEILAVLLLGNVDHRGPRGAGTRRPAGTARRTIWPTRLHSSRWRPPASSASPRTPVLVMTAARSPSTPRQLPPRMSSFKHSSACPRRGPSSSPSSSSGARSTRRHAVQPADRRGVPRPPLAGLPGCSRDSRRRRRRGGRGGRLRMRTTTILTTLFGAVLRRAHQLVPASASPNSCSSPAWAILIAYAVPPGWSTSPWREPSTATFGSSRAPFPVPGASRPIPLPVASPAPPTSTHSRAIARVACRAACFGYVDGGANLPAADAGGEHGGVRRDHLFFEAAGVACNVAQIAHIDDPLAGSAPLPLILSPTGPIADPSRSSPWPVPVTRAALTRRRLDPARSSCRGAARGRRWFQPGAVARAGSAAAT